MEDWGCNDGGGVAQMLSPQPGGLSRKQDADNKASYAFGGVTNTTAQGNPVPLVMENAVSVVPSFRRASMEDQL